MYDHGVVLAMVLEAWTNDGGRVMSSCTSWSGGQMLKCW